MQGDKKFIFHQKRLIAVREQDGDKQESKEGALGKKYTEIQTRTCSGLPGLAIRVAAAHRMN
jgi:hypothetical protein